MQYMLLIYGNYRAWRQSTPEDFATLMAGHRAFQAELAASGEFVTTSELPLDNSRIVRSVRGTVTVSDGPLTPDADILAGYYLVECGTLDRATEIASRLAEIEFGLIEVRQTSRDPQH